MEVDKDRDQARGDVADGVERLTAVVLSSHLLLCRIAIFYPWKEPFNTGAPTFLHHEIRRVGGSLYDAWERLGVSGEARRQMVQQLIVVVGRQTLEARREIYRIQHKRLQGRVARTGVIRGAAALSETEGKNERNTSGRSVRVPGSELRLVNYSSRSCALSFSDQSRDIIGLYLGRKGCIRRQFRTLGTSDFPSKL